MTKRFGWRSLAGGTAGLAIWLGGLAVVGGGPGVQAQGSSDPTFHKDVLPLLQKNCQSCHRPGQAAPMSLLTYESTRPWARSIKAKVVAREMPPWFADAQHNQFSNDRRLSDRDLDTLVRWVDGGAPPGNPADAPPPVQWPPAGWTVEPDVIVKLPENSVPATGIIENSTITVSSPFAKDTWITSMEVRPSNYAVTHHICVSVIPHKEGDEHDVRKFPPPVARDADGAEVTQRVRTPRPQRQQAEDNSGDEGFDCYVLGRQTLWMDYSQFKAARLIPGGSDLRIGLHYTTNGAAAVDTPHIGFTVAKEPPQRQFVHKSMMLRNTGRDVFAIPANDPNWKAPTNEVTINEDVEILWVGHHLHMRGRDATTRLVYPDGRSEVLLHEPKWDYQWQLIYQLATPRKVPKGTKIFTEAHYNNSSTNKANPNPNKTVYWGDQTWEEMMGNHVGVLVDLKVNPDTIVENANRDDAQ